MNAALRYEVRRITSIRSTWILLATAILLAAALSTIVSLVLSSNGPNNEALGPIITAVAANFLVWVALGTVAAQTFGQEYRHGTMRLTLTIFPRRSQVFFAKAIVCCVFITAAFLIIYLLSAGILLAGGGIGSPESTVEFIAFVARSWFYLMGFCLIVFGVTLLTRSLALGIVIPLLVAVVLEGIIVPLIIGLTSGGFTEDGPPKATGITEWISNGLPFTAGGQSAVGDDLLRNGLVYLVWIIVVTGAGLVVFQRRDA